MIKVSVILPSLNVAKYVRECIESVINQTLREIEIICVDAGSDDGTREILQEYAQKDDRILIIDSNIKSYGLQVNMGIKAAKGEYIAILETDDYVLNDMYEKLFNVAQKHKLDYVMADYMAFYDDVDGERKFFKVQNFSSVPELYHEVLSMEAHARLYSIDDTTLWRGVFSRKFLLSNDIRLNETPGAAYQDICFMHRVRMKVKRIMYINEFGYCYRTDRAESSTNSIKGLQYAKYEYQYLLEQDCIPEIYKSKIYYTMSLSLVSESRNILPRTGNVWCTADLECYEWFRDILLKAIKDGQLVESMGGESWWKPLLVLLASSEDFADRLKAVSDNLERIKRIASDAGFIIICGAGIRGQGLARILKKEIIYGSKIDILYADNDSKIWNSCISGIKVLPIELCVEQHPDAFFVIANKMHHMQIRNQLLSKGISEERIYEYRPTAKWK